MSQTTLTDRTAKLDNYLQNQMRKTGNQVRLIDLFTCCMKLFAGLLGGLFLLAVIDGWVFELSGWARWLSLVLLLGGGLSYIVLAIVPLLIRKINPVYAAKVVESAQPDMKNSLINYLLLRQQPGKVSRRVVEIVGSKAANDISGVPVENTVDKSHTIRAAMILTALVVALGGYKVLSPKDPFQTFARILAPASDITKPARVNISQVNPGNTEVFFGQKLEVSAFITGKFDPASARVVFSTLDGQIVDGSIRMEQQQRNQYTCTLRTGDRGIEQSLRYKVVAGDGVSNDYVVKMTSSPILTVESIHYSPPEYMELEEYTDQGTTTIKHYEGTRITLNAVSNTDIKSCFLQLLREEGDKLQQVIKVSMEKLDERRAKCSFKLERNALRDGQRYTHYQLHLVTEDGGRSRPLAANRIFVDPDMAPMISVVDPLETELEVPANSRIRFEVEANDVDFRLSELAVAVEDDTRRLAEEKIDIGKQDPGLLVNADYEFWPGKLSSPLRPGDVAYVQFAAFDNREPQANMTLSNQFKITITDPIDNPPKENQGSDPEESDSQQGEGEGDQSEDGQSSDSGDTGEGGKSSDGGNEKGGDQGEESANSQGQEGDSGEPGEGAEGDSGNQSQSGSEGQEGSESSGDGQSQADQPEAGEQGDETGESGQAASDQTGGTDTGEQTGENSGEPGADNSSTGQDGGDQSSGDETGDQSADQSGNEPLGDDAHEGEIFDEIMKHREEQQNQTGNEQSQNEGQSGDQSQDSAQNGTDQSQPSDSQSSDGQQQNSQSGSQSQESDSQSQQDGSQSPQTGSQSQESGSQGAEESEQQQGEQNDKQQSGDSPETDDQGMDQQGESDSQSNNEGQSDEEAGNSGESDQEQNDQSGQGSGQQQSESGQESEDKQQQQSGGGQDQQDEEQQQQQSGGGGDQQQSGGGSGQEQSSGSQEGETGESGQQQGASGSQSSDEQKGSEGNESDGASSDQSNSGSGSDSQQSSDSQQDPKQPSGDQNSDAGSPSEQGQQGGSESGSQDGAESSPQQNSGQQQDSQSSDGQQQGQQDGNDQSKQQGSQSGGGEAEQGNQKQQGEGQESGSGGSSGQQNDGQSSDEQSGGNNPGSGSASENASSQKGGADAQDGGEGTPADEANLEYTKKATDMALEYLEDQLIEPDPKLLDRIDFTEEELRDFVKRWKDLKRQGESGDEQQRREWETTLKSLGLGDGDSTKRRYEGQQDDQQGYREDGRTDKPPAGFADRFKAFTKKRNQVKDDR